MDNKPLSLKIEEVKMALAETINNSQLHPYILDSIMKDLYNEIHILYMSQSKQEIEQYNTELKEKNEKNEDNK